MDAGTVTDLLELNVTIEAAIAGAGARGRGSLGRMGRHRSRFRRESSGSYEEVRQGLAPGSKV
jgi:hypothetical protein